MEKNIILVVDDDKQMREILGEILEVSYPNKEIICTANGRDAWEKIVQKNFGIGLTITDWEMPEMNGVELTKKIKAAFPEIKVLLMSAKPPPIENPADAFLGKPFYISDLATLIQNLTA